MNDKIYNQVIQQTKESYGESFKSDLFEQYKLYINSVEKVTDRRNSANNYLLTVNSLLLTAYSFLLNTHIKNNWTFIVSIAGVLVSLTWIRIIISYRNMNEMKFSIIHEIEEHLPAGLYKSEWLLREEGRGKTYHPMTRLEIWIPTIFIILYIIIAIVEGFGFF